MRTMSTIANCPLFAGLSDRIKAQLEEHAAYRRIEEGEVYLKVGHHTRRLTVVLSGQLKFSRMNRAGKEQIFGFAEDGDVFGFSTLANPDATVRIQSIARQTTEVAEIDVTAIKNMIEREPSLGLEIIKWQSSRVAKMQELVDQLSLKDAHNRLALWLQNWLRHNRPESLTDRNVTVLPFTQSEIAAQIGTVREVVSRGFTRLEREGVLKSSGKRITILNNDALTKWASA